VKRDVRPLIEVKRLNAKPLLKKTPKTNGITIIDKKMINRIQDLVAKGTISAIRPTSLLQPIICPKPILERKPHEGLDFRRSPKLPHRGGDRESVVSTPWQRLSFSVVKPVVMF
jgi:hypothetical protein